ncbi:MAG: exosortase [Planctomycetes bacterium]|nr:exosortase [Planctomycetota bacterium]
MTPFVAVFLPLLVAYAPTWWWCMQRWSAETQYFAHGWLVPFVATWLVWQRRATWSSVERGTDLRAWWLLGPALLLHLAGALLMVDSWSAASLCLAVPGAAWLALGRARLRGLWPVLGLVFFLVPLPIYVEGRVAFELKEAAVVGGTWLADLFGLDVERHGDHLHLRDAPGALYVAPACGGLRSLLAMSTLAYCLAFFLGGTSWLRRAVLLVAAPLFAIAANSVRIAVLCAFLRWRGAEFAHGFGHDLANVGEWVALLAALLLLDRVLPRADGPGAVPSAGRDVVVRSASLRGPAVALWLLAPLACGLALYRPAAGPADRAAGLPSSFQGHEFVPRSPEAEARFQRDRGQFRELLGTDDFVWRTFRAPDGGFVNLTALFHDTNWKSVHPPRICIEGSGFDVQADDTVALPQVAAGLHASRIVARRRSDGRVFVTLTVYGTRDWLAGDYRAFVWHHLPRALLRQAVSGFQLRVESPLAGADGEALQRAEARCVGFLQALLPYARERLR